MIVIYQFSRVSSGRQVMGKEILKEAKIGTWYYLDGIAMAAPALESALYIVSTPIGNLGDITVRALQTLAAVDILACEDKRVTGVLLKHFGIRRETISYHEHNAEVVRPKIIDALCAGKSVALVSDAGTPLVSDPGFRLVKETISNNCRVIPVPGPSALLAAIVGSGLETNSIFFSGFLPRKMTGRRKFLEELKAIRATLVFYEAPNRLKSALEDMEVVFGGDRNAVVAREITKLYETIERGSISELIARFNSAPKGEIVIIIGPPGVEVLDDAVIDSLLLDKLLNNSVSSASGQVAKLTNLNRQELYKRALQLKSTQSKRNS